MLLVALLFLQYKVSIVVVGRQLVLVARKLKTIKLE